jgi:hypothetical protein
VSVPDHESQIVSLTGAIRGETALAAMLAPAAVAADAAELLVVAMGVTRIDVVTGVALRLRISRHLRCHPRGSVTLWPPSDPLVAQRLIELLGPLPEAVIVTPEVELRPRVSFGVVPTTVIPDVEAATLAARFALKACEAAGITAPRSALAVKAIVELSDNALRHAGPAADAPVMAMTVAERTRALELAVTDSGTAISGHPDPGGVLAAFRGARDGDAFLADLLRQGVKRRLDVRLEVLSGTARLRWTPLGHRIERIQHVSGTTAIARIGPEVPADG